MKKLALAIAAAALAVVGLAAPAQATKPVSSCSSGWYVNPDEAALTPLEKSGGLLFDGPSLVHHAASGLLVDAAGDGSFVAVVQAGVAPLFKFETSKPYSTINKTAAGLYWSSKIVAGEGSQASPVTLAKLATLAPYTEATVLLSFGVGYANDAGNKALVTAVVYAKITYSFTCVPKTTTPTSTTVPPTTSSVPTSTSSPATTSEPPVISTTSSTAAGVGVGTTVIPAARTGTVADESLAYTGAGMDPAGLLIGAALMILGGAGLIVMTIRRRRARR